MVILRSKSNLQLSTETISKSEQIHDAVTLTNHEQTEIEKWNSIGVIGMIEMIVFEAKGVSK